MQFKLSLLFIYPKLIDNNHIYTISALLINPSEALHNKLNISFSSKYKSQLVGIDF